MYIYMGTYTLMHAVLHAIALVVRMYEIRYAHISMYLFKYINIDMYTYICNYF